MKFIHTFFILLLIGYIICDCDYSKIGTDYSVDKCKSSNTGDGYCCYVETPKDTDDPKGCRSLSKYKYDNIKDIVKYYKKFGGKKGDEEDKDAKIDCKSFYLQISSIILILLLI